MISREFFKETMDTIIDNIFSINEVEDSENVSIALQSSCGVLMSWIEWIYGEHNGLLAMYLSYAIDCITQRPGDNYSFYHYLIDLLETEHESKVDKILVDIKNVSLLKKLYTLDDLYDFYNDLSSDAKLN